MAARGERLTNKRIRQEEIELVFDRERPGVRESGAAMKADVLHRDEKFPERRNFRDTRATSGKKK